MIFGKCDSGKTELLKALKDENQRLNNQLCEDSEEDSEKDEEEALD